ncbi:hypothetical protein [Candidatus Phytoplasma meliae]|uniref:Effector n=1 Tax=Candidatus Phytoplasma meliae TaxID=1848402 RepID=A0ABS5CXE8_9MOLU|nr:hypothetical protein [Candidatus Phytoplasma meliae]MBP5835648.1 hypothetical protein [Candidatus Phytoplasma meliae]
MSHKKKKFIVNNCLSIKKIFTLFLLFTPLTVLFWAGIEALKRFEKIKEVALELGAPELSMSFEQFNEENFIIDEIKDINVLQEQRAKYLDLAYETEEKPSAELLSGDDNDFHIIHKALKTNKLKNDGVVKKYYRVALKDAAPLQSLYLKVNPKDNPGTQVIKGDNNAVDNPTNYFRFSKLNFYNKNWEEVGLGKGNSTTDKLCLLSKEYKGDRNDSQLVSQHRSNEIYVEVEFKAENNAFKQAYEKGILWGTPESPKTKRDEKIKLKSILLFSGYADKDIPDGVNSYSKIGNNELTQFNPKNPTTV